MAWKMSAAKRRALVKLQLRDRKGRWIEMGGGVKWFSSRLGKNVGGTVVGTQGSNALVRLNPENGSKESPLVKVPARSIEVVDSKATLPSSDGKHNAPEAPAPAPQPNADESVPRAQRDNGSATAIPEQSDTPEDYNITDTPDGHTYVSRKDGAEMYFPARGLKAGDEILAPAGADPTKPFSIGKNWATKDAERLNNDGPLIGRVVAVSGDRYAVVRLPDGQTIKDKDGNDTDTVTVGLTNRVIKAGPGMKEALGDKLNGANFSTDNRADDEHIDEADPEAAKSDHAGREVRDDLQGDPAQNDFGKEAPAVKTFKLRGQVLDNVEAAVNNATEDPGVRLDGPVAEVYDADKARKTIEGIRAQVGDNESLNKSYQKILDALPGAPEKAAGGESLSGKSADDINKLPVGTKLTGPDGSSYEKVNDNGPDAATGDQKVGSWVHRDSAGNQSNHPGTDSPLVNSHEISMLRGQHDWKIDNGSSSAPETPEINATEVPAVPETPAKDKPKISFNVRGATLDELKFGISTVESDGRDSGLSVNGNKVEVTDVAKAIHTVQGPLDVLKDSIDYNDMLSSSERAAAKRKRDGLQKILNKLTDAKGSDAKAPDAAPKDKAPEASAPNAPETPQGKPLRNEDGTASVQNNGEEGVRDLISSTAPGDSISTGDRAFTRNADGTWTDSKTGHGDHTDENLVEFFKGKPWITGYPKKGSEGNIDRSEQNNLRAKTLKALDDEPSGSYAVNVNDPSEQYQKDHVGEWYSTKGDRRLISKDELAAKFENNRDGMRLFDESDPSRPSADKSDKPADTPATGANAADTPEAPVDGPAPADTADAPKADVAPAEKPVEAPQKGEQPVDAPEAPKADSAPAEDAPAAPDAPKANVSLDDLEKQAEANGDTMLYHGGLPEGTTLDGIDLNRNGTQQNRRGRSYGGFYLTDKSSKKWSDDYAERRNGVVHGFALDKNARIDDRGSQQIDRVSAEERAKAAENFDVIKGKDLLGRVQYILLNKDAINGVGETNIKNAPEADSPNADAPKVDAPNTDAPSAPEATPQPEASDAPEAAMPTSPEYAAFPKSVQSHNDPEATSEADKPAAEYKAGDILTPKDTSGYGSTSYVKRSDGNWDEYKTSLENMVSKKRYSSTVADPYASYKSYDQPKWSAETIKDGVDPVQLGQDRREWDRTPGVAQAPDPSAPSDGQTESSKDATPEAKSPEATKEPTPQEDAPQESSTEQPASAEKHSSPQEVQDALGELAQTIEDIQSEGISGHEAWDLIDSASAHVRGSDGRPYFLTASEDDNGEWAYDLKPLSGGDPIESYSVTDEDASSVAKQISDTLGSMHEPTAPEAPQDNAPEAPAVQVPSAPEYNDNGLTPEEQTNMDAYNRLADRARSQFKDADEAYYRSLADDIMKKGADRNRDNAPSEAAQSEVPAEKAPETPQAPQQEQSAPEAPASPETPEYGFRDLADRPHEGADYVVNRMSEGDAAKLPIGSAIVDNDPNSPTFGEAMTKVGEDKWHSNHSTESSYDSSNRFYSDYDAADISGHESKVYLAGNENAPSFVKSVVNDFGDSAGKDESPTGVSSPADSITETVARRGRARELDWGTAGEHIDAGKRVSLNRRFGLAETDEERAAVLTDARKEARLGANRPGSEGNRQAQVANKIEDMSEGTVLESTTDEGRTFTKVGPNQLKDSKDGSIRSIDDVLNESGTAGVRPAQNKESKAPSAHEGRSDVRPPSGPTNRELEEAKANDASEPWDASDIESNIRDWFDFAQAVKDGDTRAREAMERAKSLDHEDEEAFIVVNDKKQPFDVTLTLNDDGEPVVRLGNFDDTSESYGDWAIDKSVSPSDLAAQIHKAINSDDPAETINDPNGENAPAVPERRTATPEAAPNGDQFEIPGLEESPEDKAKREAARNARIRSLDYASEGDHVSLTDDYGNETVYRKNADGSWSKLDENFDELNQPPVPADNIVDDTVGQKQKVLNENFEEKSAPVEEIVGKLDELKPGSTVVDSHDGETFKKLANGTWKDIADRTSEPQTTTDMARYMSRGGDWAYQPARERFSRTRNRNEATPAPAEKVAPQNDAPEAPQKAEDTPTAPKAATPDTTADAPEEAPTAPEKPQNDVPDPADNLTEAEQYAKDNPPISEEEAGKLLEQLTNSNPLPEGIERHTPEAVEGEAYPPTQQQQDVIDAVLGGLNTLVQAKAGAGKTSTLRAIARRLEINRPGDNIGYIAFNKSVQLEAEGSMPNNVEPRTGHSIAWRWANDTPSTKWMTQNRLKDRNALRRSDEIAAHLGIYDPLDGGTRTDAAGSVVPRRAFSPSEQAMAATRTVDAFANSADDVITRDHLPDTVKSMSPEIQDSVLASAQKAWEDLSSPDGRLNMTFDHVRKHWALSRPDFSRNGSGLKRPVKVLFLDEAQDTPPVLAKVVADQKIQRVIVGDADQAIYGFTGATDYLSTAQGDVELPLNKSWRFGPQVADYGNRFLQLVGSKGRVVGGGPDSKITHGMTDADAVLVRSNGGMLGEIAKELENGRTVGVPKGTKKDLESLVQSIRYLQGSGNAPYQMHDDLAPFRSWDEFEAEAGKNDNPNLTKIQNMVNNFGVQRMSALISQITEMSDAHTPVGSDGQSEVFKDVEFKQESFGIVADGRGTYANKDFMREAGFRYGEFPDGRTYRSGPRRGQKKKAWIAYGNDEESSAKLAKAKELAAAALGVSDEPTPMPDVIISTAHKSKGLEWGRVRIGDDFRGPRIDPNTEETIMPEPEELRLAYVAVTRAEKELDPGSLDWIRDYTDENGDPSFGDKVPSHEADITPSENAPEAPAKESTPEAPQEAPAAPEKAPEAPEKATEAPSAPEKAPESTATDTPSEASDAPALNDDGLTGTEEAYFNELNNRIADSYAGRSDEDVTPLEDEVDRLLAHGEKRQRGEDVPEWTPNVGQSPDQEASAVEDAADAPENLPEPVDTTPVPTGKRPRATYNGEIIKDSAGNAIATGDTVGHRRLGPVTITSVSPRSGRINFITPDGRKGSVGSHLVTRVDPNAPTAPEGSEAQVSASAPGDVFVDHATGKKGFIDKNGQSVLVGDTVENRNGARGKITAVYRNGGRAWPNVEFEDGRSSRVMGHLLSKVDNGGNGGVDSPEVNAPKAPSAPETPSPAAPEAPAAPDMPSDPSTSEGPAQGLSPAAAGDALPSGRDGRAVRREMISSAPVGSRIDSSDGTSFTKEAPNSWRSGDGYTFTDMDMSASAAADGNGSRLHTPDGAPSPDAAPEAPSNSAPDAVDLSSLGELKITTTLRKAPEGATVIDGEGSVWRKLAPSSIGGNGSWTRLNADGSPNSNVKVGSARLALYLKSTGGTATYRPDGGHEVGAPVAPAAPEAPSAHDTPSSPEPPTSTPEVGIPERGGARYNTLNQKPNGTVVQNRANPSNFFVRVNGNWEDNQGNFWDTATVSDSVDPQWDPWVFPESEVLAAPSDEYDTNTAARESRTRALKSAPVGSIIVNDNGMLFRKTGRDEWVFGNEGSSISLSRDNNTLGFSTGDRETFGPTWTLHRSKPAPAPAPAQPAPSAAPAAPEGVHPGLESGSFIPDDAGSKSGLRKVGDDKWEMIENGSPTGEFVNDAAAKMLHRLRKTEIQKPDGVPDLGLQNVFGEGVTLGAFLSDTTNSFFKPQWAESKKKLKAGFQQFIDHLSTKLPDGVTSELTELDMYNRTATARIKFKDRDGDYIGAATRTFLMWENPDTGELTPVVDHTLFKITDEDMKGGGISSAFLKESQSFYKQLGVEKITVHANIDIGGYAWARAGFRFDSFESAKNFLRYTNSRRGRTIFAPLGREDEWKAGWAKYDEMVSRMTKTNFENGTAPTPADFSQIGYDPSLGRGRDVMWFGKSLMLDNDWNGVMDV